MQPLCSCRLITETAEVEPWPARLRVLVVRLSLMEQEVVIAAG